MVTAVGFIPPVTGTPIGTVDIASPLDALPDGPGTGADFSITVLIESVVAMVSVDGVHKHYKMRDESPWWGVVCWKKLALLQ